MRHCIIYAICRLRGFTNLRNGMNGEIVIFITFIDKTRKMSLLKIINGSSKNRSWHLISVCPRNVTRNTCNYMLVQHLTHVGNLELDLHSRNFIINSPQKSSSCVKETWKLLKMYVMKYIFTAVVLEGINNVRNVVRRLKHSPQMLLDY